MLSASALQGEADVTVDHITRMNIQQFRHFISNAKVAGSGFGAEKADESFAAMAPLCRVLLPFCMSVRAARCDQHQCMRLGRRQLKPAVNHDCA